ncbi:hypothetical protein VCR4J2_40056 [Vibrio coralliirubri]|nr:hypothetical protein VCR4J2_40056 [Vibrio coralliirubri]
MRSLARVLLHGNITHKLIFLPSPVPVLALLCDSMELNRKLRPNQPYQLRNVPMSKVNGRVKKHGTDRKRRV